VAIENGFRRIDMEETFGLEDYSEGERTFSVDPVCGASVEESKAAGKTGYAGEMYYFCSADCKRNFELDPAAYVARLGARGR
jgi:YHS domain-containing protein